MFSQSWQTLQKKYIRYKLRDFTSTNCLYDVKYVLRTVVFYEIAY